MFSLVLYASSHPGSAFLVKASCSDVNQGRGSTCVSVPCTREVSPRSFAAQDTMGCSDTPRDGNTEINAGLERVTFCLQILKITLYHYLYNPMSSALMITSPSSSACPPCTQPLHGKELLTTCCSCFTFTKNAFVLSLQLGSHIWSPEIWNTTLLWHCSRCFTSHVPSGMMPPWSRPFTLLQPISAQALRQLLKNPTAALSKRHNTS